jgi:tetratricopeptide (TPR) repeat protein
MKKILLTMLGVALMAAPALAQMPMGVSVQKVDVNKLKAAIAKSDAEIADAKKAAKAATWIKRGNTFIDVDLKPVNGIYVSMPEMMLKATYGDAPTAVENIGGTDFTVYTYEHFKAYLLNGAVEYYVPTTVIDPAALDKALEAFEKAYELDPQKVKEVSTGLEAIKRKSVEDASTEYTLGDYKKAAADFRRAFDASTQPASAAIDTLSLYYAGMSDTFGLDHAAAVEDLSKALELGYEADGDIYRLLFVAYYNLERRPEALAILQKGMALYPANEDLIDMMMRYYAENDGDASSLIPTVEEAIAKNPENPALYQGLARIYDKLGQIDNAISTIHKAVELAPEDFLSNYLEGLFIVKKGDEMSLEVGKQSFTSRTEAQEAQSKVSDVFRAAIAPLEKAYSLNNEEIATVELLKNLTFRLREDEGMQAKNDKYSELFNTMTGAAQ